MSPTYSHQYTHIWNPHQRSKQRNCLSKQLFPVQTCLFLFTNALFSIEKARSTIKTAPFLIKTALFSDTRAEYNSKSPNSPCLHIKCLYLPIQHRLHTSYVGIEVEMAYTLHAYICLCTTTYVLHICECVYIYVYIYVHICIYMYICKCMYIHIYIYNNTTATKAEGILMFSSISFIFTCAYNNFCFFLNLAFFFLLDLTLEPQLVTSRLPQSQATSSWLWSLYFWTWRFFFWTVHLSLTSAKSVSKCRNFFPHHF